ncbi:TlpA disulfide reductase family protein [Pedobacter sp. PLR]|uniref:TlpA family protein disulfide reductase n=1 Tax=Pedobacter sp. PLR TaxID=2994465 RepID=UPI00224585DF|nr:TlpA disulfide reductase family protein [Pedobacter sp. PLR]MCX2450321.1 TlpA disulfide reductase family protein [Pedobacter sp. PLR]
MKLNNNILALSIFVFSCFSLKNTAFAQEKMMNVGDLVPNTFIPKIINSSRKNANLSDYKDKLLIIDFWATNCSGCVAALPKMDSLQKVFGAKLEIMPVTYEKEQLVAEFWKKNKHTKGLNLPTVIEDKALSNLFKHRSIPHEIWINKGKVVAITNSEYVNDKNISAILNGKKISWPVKNDMFVFDIKQPLFQVDQQQYSDPKGLLTYTAIGNYFEGLKTKIGSVDDPVTGSRRNYLINYPILNAYYILWNELIPKDSLIAPFSLKFNLNQVLLEVKDPSRYIFDSKQGYREEWIRKNGICYERVFKNHGQSKKAEYSDMIADLDCLLNLHCRWEKRSRKCLILVRTDAIDRIKSKGGTARFEVDKPLKVLRNTPISSVIDWLNQYQDNPYVFDETGYKNPVDLDLTIRSWTDVLSIRKALKAYGLDLKEEMKVVDILILTEGDAYER